MGVVGIVCEYNPFHNGHEYQMLKIREMLGAETKIVCVMSGDFVQRGEAALLSKHARAEAACLCGADLVLELPLPWAVASAEGFAAGAVKILHELGAEYLCFGSEAGETEKLQKIAGCIAAPGFQREVAELMDRQGNLSFAAARQGCLEKYIGADAALIEKPNNILGIEYLKAINALSSNMIPLTVKRTGSAHDSKLREGRFCSASELRRMMEKGENFGAYMPQRAHALLKNEINSGRMIDRGRIDTALVSRLRSMSADEFEDMPDSGNGIGMRIYKAVMEESTLDGIALAAKTKRYAFSRIKRICVRAALGISREMCEGLPEYTRVLSAAETGFGILKNAKGGNLTIVTKPAQMRGEKSKSAEIFAAAANAHDIYVLGYSGQDNRKGGEDWRTGPEIVQIT